MNDKRLSELLENIQDVDVCVYGDFCLDAYWLLDPSGSEESVETGVKAEAVRKHYYSPGGASNVAANMAALSPRSIRAIGSVGPDIFGRELRRQLDDLGVKTDHLLVQEEDGFETLAFCKHYMDLHETLRVDFGTLNHRSAKVELKLLEGLERALDECSIVIFNQQVPGTLANEDFIAGANELFAAANGTTVLLDSRHYGDKFHSVGRKINEVEAALLCGAQVKPRDVIERDKVIEYGRRLFDTSGKPVFITRGPKGIMSFDESGYEETPGIQLDVQLDTVGAGDTTLSAIALCLGAGTNAAQAAELANIAASVTVQKLRRTGTANGREIQELNSDVRYIHQPELAADGEKATYLADTQVEVCGTPPAGTIRFAIFDHDGTISTLRHGWEAIMEPVMMSAILGSGTHPEDTVQKIRDEVLDYIDRSTGIQTILQMEALRQMACEAGFVAEDRVLSSPEYKDIYNNALMVSVEERMTQVRSGERSAEDFIIPGALDFLGCLRQQGIKLFLASGTDREDVMREADYLGYGSLFDGGIYGAVGDISKYSKKKLLREVIEKNGLGRGELLVVGDGPVEIQECRRQNGTAIGVASEEATGVGLDFHKRSRLIRAGAHVVIPDLTWGDRVLEYLHVK
jgi:rfaE bifunctional protein kinase chain/domain